MPKVSEEYRARRREEILAAAVVCFSRAGFHGTTMADVVRESGLSPGAIYGYFAGKDEIIESIADIRHAGEEALFARVAREGDPVRGLHLLVQEYSRWLADEGEVLRRRVNVQAWAEAVNNLRVRAQMARGAKNAHDVIAELIARGQRSGAVVAGLDPDATARAMVALFQGLVLQLAWEESVDLAEYRATVEQLLEGILVSRGAGR